MNKAKLIPTVIILILIPLIIFLGYTLFSGKEYAFIIMAVTILAMIPFFLSFEKGEQDSKKIIIVAVMIALSVISRLIFAVTPGFKPVTAMVIITALYFGPEAGFMTGALTPMISNLYFAQGPWTPFQMLVWGLIGFAAGVFRKSLLKNLPFLLLYGGLSGVIYSLLMDVWLILWYEGGFNLIRYQVAVVSALPTMIIYGLSNIIFLLLLKKPLGVKLHRLKTKYGL